MAPITSKNDTKESSDIFIYLLIAYCSIVVIPFVIIATYQLVKSFFELCSIVVNILQLHHNIVQELLWKLRESSDDLSVLFGPHILEEDPFQESLVDEYVWINDWEVLEA
ncbi:uncharacterized protein RJT20DRAFT_3430 [Scheffersomyces xylosifermentans]|uniref:uncharacterized protein n=1 Tax=Scheffersomyces xylosifermentans TaxID=1304137 RepID=UPI00315CC837